MATTSRLVSPTQTSDTASPLATNIPDGSEYPVLPARCFDTCDNAYTEVQLVGKVPSMCDVNSDSWRGYQECTSCIKAEADDAEMVIETQIDPGFKQFMDYCASQPPQPSYPSAVLTTRTVVQLADVTFGGKVKSGVLRTWIVTEPKASFTDLRSATSNALSPQTTPTETMPAGTSATAAQEPSPEPDKAWVAGPVIGVVTAILLVLAGLWFLRRRSRRALDWPAAAGNGHGREEFIKTQLHSGSWPKATAEMSANEIAAEELPVSVGRHVEGVTGRNSGNGANPVLF
ncbi:hypothetical protein LX36DRAFT_377858 [Colletotrichum falcatum]|nr:hypothetical protein LX36DRAFT_377858 [Colletotrichum falcatum]